MQKNLVIVESPAKAKTIEKFLGDDFKVMSSYGHIRDLKKKELSVDIDTLQPDYEIPEEKVKVVKPKRCGSHPMRTARENPYHGIFVRYLVSTRKRQAESCSTK